MPIQCDQVALAAKIRIRPDLRISLCRSADKPYVLIEDTLSSNFYRLGLQEWKMARLFDGQRTLRSVADAVPQSSHEVAKVGQWLTQIGLAHVVEGSLTSSTDRKENSAAKPSWVSLAGRNLLFIKVTFPNPEWLLRKIHPCVAWLFSSPGIAPWLLTCGLGFWTVIHQWTRFQTSVQDVFAPNNWLHLLAIWLLLKVVHELAHATVCLRHGGTVTRCGLMFILFSPIAWVDVTSAWSFRSKWSRIAVSGAGMYAECFLAAVAAIVWGWTINPWLEMTCRNIIFMAGLSTVLFNLNCLMRFDGYYMLADWLNIQNLYQAGQRYVRHLAKRHVLNMPSNPPRVEPRLVKFVVLYGFAAIVWRVCFCIGILIAAAHFFHGAGLLMAVLSGVVWFGLPVLRLGVFLWKGHGDQQPDRARVAVVSVLAVAIVGTVLALPWPSSRRAHGVVDFLDMHTLRADSPGFIKRIRVQPGQSVEWGQVLMEIANPNLRRELADLELQIQLQTIRQRILLQSDEKALYLAANRKLESLREQRDQLQQRVHDLHVRAPVSGEIIAADLSWLQGSYVRIGQELISVGAPDAKAVRIVVGQQDANVFRAHVGESVRLGVHGSSRSSELARLDGLRPRATRRLPHPVLSATMGGPLTVQKKGTGARNTTELVEPCFEGLVTLPQQVAHALRSGQRCVVALRGAHQSVGRQLWASFREFVTRKASRSQAS